MFYGEYNYMIIFALEKITLDIMFRDFPGGPVVKTLPSNAGAACSIPGQGAKILHA